LEKDLPGMQKLKASRSRYFYIRQSRFYTKIRRDKKGHHILTEETVWQEGIYAQNIGACRFRNKNPDTKIVRNLNTLLSSIGRTSRQNINEDKELNNTVDKMDLTDIYGEFHSMAADNTFFSAVHETFSKIDHILGHRANLKMYKRTETLPCILTDHIG
jgi:hypothetical protein